jgi:hypothetical protein
VYSNTPVLYRAESAIAPNIVSYEGDPVATWDCIPPLPDGLNLNADGSHGPLKCGSCHEVNSNGIPTWMQGVEYNGKRIRNFDDAVSWAHTFTDEATVLGPGEVCENCHQDRSDKISETSGKWLRHTYVDRIGRQIQDKAEREALFACAVGTDNALQSCSSDADCFDLPEDIVGGACVGDVAGGKYVDAAEAAEVAQEDPSPFNNALYGSVCTSCHQLNGGPDQGFNLLVDGCPTIWKQHLTEGRLSEKVWEHVSETEDGTSCGW